MRRLGVFVILLASLCVSQSALGQQKIWTLKDCVDHAVEHNISVKQFALDFENSKIDEKDALGNFIPNLNLQSSISNNSGLALDPVTNEFGDRANLVCLI